MPKISSNTKTEVPEHLRPYKFLGLDPQWRDGDENAIADCPWCGREGKLNILIETGQWRCVVCEEGNEKGGGNARVFLRMLWDKSFDATTSADYQDLTQERRLLDDTTPLHWHLAKSILTDDWIVPGYGADGKVNTVYRYLASNGRMAWIPTPTLGHQLFGRGLYEPDKNHLYLCEGLWDAMALWEMLRQVRLDEDEGNLVGTSNVQASLLGDANVLAIPGNLTFFESWIPLFSGKTVHLMTQNDHPRKHPKTGEVIEPASLHGMKRIAGFLTGGQDVPHELNYLHWGAPDGAGYDPELKSGYDVRDELAGEAPHPRPLAARITALEGLLGKVRGIPPEWVSGAPRGSKRDASSNGSGGLVCLPCDNFRQLVMAWRKAMKWTEGLDVSLSVMLASIASTQTVGEQLWIKVLGPASCGKSTLCEAVSISPYILAKSTIRGFHSGWKGDDGEDVSLVAQLSGKTLVTKDGDTLLQSPNLGQILAEARDIYDSVSRTHYRNSKSTDYSGIRMTWLLCGTNSLKSIDSSELGERFLDCVMMEGIDDDLEDEILMRVAHRADRNMAVLADDNPMNHYEPAMAHAMQLTGGYVNYLRENATDLLSSVEFPDEALYRCSRFGKFIAHLRARPSVRQDEVAEREFAARLVSQLIRLAKCLAIVMNRDKVDEPVMARVKKVALDTSRGQTLQIVDQLASTSSMEVKTIAMYTARPESKTRDMLRFMKKIGMVENCKAAVQPGARANQPRWKLTERFRKIYDEVHADQIPF